jgi:hypothetical protein
MSKVLTPERLERLKQTLASGSRLGASDLRLINVDVYRERLGKNWFKYKGIIHAYAAEAIKAELSREDFFVETKSGYGIFFFKKDVEEVQTISDRIAERLTKQLSREPIFGDPPLGCEARSVNCDDLLRELEGEDPPPPPPPLEPAKADQAAATPVRYAPLWHAKLERVVGSISSLQSMRSKVRQPDTEYYNPTPAQVSHDIAAFNAALAAAYKLHKAGIGATIIFSVNFKAFCAPHFKTEYMNALRQTPGQLLPFLTPRFVRIAPGTPQIVLASKVQLLSTIFRRAILQTKPVFDVKTFEFVPCTLICTTWPEIEATAASQLGPERSLFDVAKTFRESAHRLRANAMVDGVNTLAALDTVMSAGIDLVSGPAISEPLAAPPPQAALALTTIRSPRKTSPAAPSPAATSPAAPPPQRPQSEAVSDTVFEV